MSHHTPHHHNPPPTSAGQMASTDPSENISIFRMDRAANRALPILGIQVSDYYAKQQGDAPVPQQELRANLQQNTGLVNVPINIWCNLIAGNSQVRDTNAAKFIAGLTAALQASDLDTFNQFMTKAGFTVNAENNIQVFLDENDKTFEDAAAECLAQLAPDATNF